MRTPDTSDNRVLRQGDMERRNYVLSLVKVQVGSYCSGPYADYDALWKRGDVKERFFSSGYILESEENLAMGLEADHLPEITLARWTAARHVTERLRELGITAQECSERTSLQKSTISRFATGQRALTMEPEQVIPLCYLVLRESVNRVYFGFDGQIVLPGIYSGVMKRFCALPSEARQRLVQGAESLKEEWLRHNPAVHGIGQHMDVRKLVCKRMQELHRDSGRTVMEFLRGEKTPAFLRANMRYYFEESVQNSSPFPKLPFLAFVALELKMPLDYFLAEDFTPYAPCCYKDGDKVFPITDPLALRFLGAIYSVDDDTSAKMTAPLLWEYCQSAEN